MEEVSLYRKYRPHNFDNLVGQDHVKETLINAFKSGKVSHAYLFSGPRGTGKTSTARLIAKALNCQNPEDGYEPCNNCEFCKEINENRLIDIIEIDAASNRGIDEVRDLKEKIGFAPTHSKVKVYIIDEVHMMTKEAFNALLKTLEEPPNHAYFILATTEIHKIPETIISRCQRFDFRRISKKALMTRLSYIAQKESIETQDSALEIIARYVDGGMRDAIGLLEQLTVNKKLDAEHVQEILGISSNSLLNNLFDSLMVNDTKASLNVVNQLHNQGSDFKQFLHEFVDLVRGKMLESVNSGTEDQLGRLIKMIEVLQEAQQKVDKNIPQLPLEIAIIRITGNLKEAIIEETPKKEKKSTPEAKKTKPEPESRPEEKTRPEESTESTVLPLTISYLKEKWPRITERVRRPSLKMSLRNASVVAVAESDVTLQFATQFHKDKVMEHDNRVELEQVIEEIFKKGVKLKALVKELEMKSVVDEEKSPEKNDFTNEALEIFGGELVEEED